MLIIIADILLWGMAATVAALTILEIGQGVGLTRFSLPFLLGTFATSIRHQAYAGGFALAFLGGWMFAALYGVIFLSLGEATWWLGLVLGVGHGLFVVAVLLPLLPHLHPRIASEDAGPTPRRRLEPPGFMGLYYGRATPAVVLAAMAVYGTVLGAFLRV